MAVLGFLINKKKTPMKVYIDTNDIPTNSLREASLRKHYKALLKKGIVTQDTVKNFARDLESLKYCSKSVVVAVLFFCNISFAQSGVVVAGKTENNISYTIGGGLVPLQIEEITEEVLLGLPKFEKPTKTYIPKPKAPIKKPNFFQRLFKALFG
jgi:hypothetical protein